MACLPAMTIYDNKMTMALKTTLRMMLPCMTSIFSSAFLLSGLIIPCSSNVQITSSPQTVNNATLGSTVRFECQTSTTSAIPGWNINGIDYRVTDLPLGYKFHDNLNSKVLIVSPVEVEMNNSVYFCYLTFYTPEGRERIESDPAMIIIQAPNYISSLTSTTLHVESSATTSVYSSSPLFTSSMHIKSISSTLLYTGLPVAMSTSIIMKKDYNPLPSSVPKRMQHTNVMVGGVIGASATLILLLTSTIIALAIWICRYRKRKDEKKSSKKCKEDYAEIIALPPVYPNPSYEHCKLKVAKNPAYEFNKPQSYTSSNPRDHVYDDVKELQNS